MTKIGIVVPTIGGRPEYLPLALKSIREAGDAYILLVGNADFNPTPLKNSGLIDEYLCEVETGLAAKINFGFRSLPDSVEFINWLGDDDLLEPDSLRLAATILEGDSRVAFVYGGCEYIDHLGRPIWLQKSGAWAVPLLRFGPQLVPHPGSLYRRTAFDAIGGLDTKYGWAFDFKLFLGLSKIGKAVFVNKTLAKFRWHPGSLSVGRRRESVKEASRVRVENLPNWLKPISPVWEWPVMQATYWAGIRLSRRLEH